jgi:two-component system nitrogen regulation response regulator GlnG
MILVVDDHEEFRSALAEHLRDDGFVVQEFRCPGELPALDTLGSASLLITDYLMPDENGLVFADRFHAVHPRIPILMITANWEKELQRQVLARDNVYLFCKPIDHMMLSRLVDDLVVERASEASG